MNVLFQFDLSRIQPSTVYLDLAHLINQGGLQYSMSVLAAYLFRHSNLSQSESTLYSQLRKYKCICEWKCSIQCYTTVYNCIPVCLQSFGCGLFCVYLCRRKLIAVMKKETKSRNACETNWQVIAIHIHLIHLFSETLRVPRTYTRYAINFKILVYEVYVY